VEVVADTDGFLRFRTLTLVPIDLRLADLGSLTEAERHWLDVYHAEVAAAMDGLLEPEVADWLAARTAPIIAG
jgi:Xaa-Pro aminopeptidase